MTAEHVRNTAGAYPGAPANAVANLNELENWLGRELNFVSLNLGITGDAVLDFKEARSVSRALYVNEGCFRMEYPDKIMCVTMPIATAPPNAGLSPAQKAALMDRVSAGEADEHLELIFGRMDQSAGLTIVRLASESDINFTPYSLVDAEESWSRCWNYCALKANRFNLPCIDITWNGSGPQRWETVDLRSELYSSFGGDFYLANGKATGYGSAAEVLARIALTQAEAQERGKAFTISEWGIWSGRGITSTQAADFVQALWDLLVTFPSSGPGALLYWNHFWGKTDVSLRGWPLAYQLWRDLLIGEA